MRSHLLNKCVDKLSNNKRFKTPINQAIKTRLYSTSTRAGEGAICRYLSRQGKIAEDIHETKSSGIFLS